MFSVLVATFEISMLISFLLFVPLTFLLRLQTVIKHKKSLKEALMIVFVPFSLGYYYYLPEEQRNKYYNVTIIVFLVLSVVGILFTVYQWIPPFLNP